MINVYSNSPYLYEVIKNDSGSTISNIKENLVFGGKKAVQFEKEVLEGQGQGKYKETIIYYGENTYLYITLNQLNEEVAYQNFLNSIKFK